MLLSGCWRLACTHPICSHFTLYATGAPPATTLVVVPRVGGFVYVLGPCGPFNQILLRDQQLILPPQPPQVFTARSHGYLFSWHWNPGLCGMAWCWDHSLPRHPSQSLSTTCGCGTAHSAGHLCLASTAPCFRSPSPLPYPSG